MELAVNNIKPVATYRGSHHDIAEGYCAHLFDVKGHPSLGDCPEVRTSTVVAYDDITGQIETRNTVYRRA